MNFFNKFTNENYEYLCLDEKNWL